VVGTALVGGVDGPATAADVVPFLVVEVPLAGWDWEGEWVCDWDSGEGPGSARFDGVVRL
jgi:hypothetical protein